MPVTARAVGVVAAVGVAAALVIAASGLGGASGSGASCPGFALSLASDRGGQPSPLDAALQFVAHEDVESLAHSGWQVASRDRSGVTLRSGTWTLHAVQGPDRTWQVDSGTAC